MTAFRRKLAKIANLKVISHESVARYRGAHNTQEIGRALNVAICARRQRAPGSWQDPFKRQIN